MDHQGSPPMFLIITDFLIFPISFWGGIKISNCDCRSIFFPLVLSNSASSVFNFWYCVHIWDCHVDFKIITYTILSLVILFILKTKRCDINWDLFYSLVCGLSWQMFCAHLKRMHSAALVTVFYDITIDAPAGSFLCLLFAWFLFF